MIGTTVSHYKIIGKLGEGGMGVVYRAHDSQLGREVAIKVLPELFTQDEERLARFEREARMLAALDHANIASIYGLEEQDGKRFLIMQLAEGETLQERIAHGPIPVQESLKIARQIAEALESAHAKGIIHRDLKPANVKVGDQGQVKVLDFGLAKAIEGDSTMSGSHPSLMESPTLTAQMTGQGVLLGTAAYMSPEQARGEAADKRSDLWAFGVLLWEMLTGNQLFVGKTMSDTLAGVLRDEPHLDALPHDTPASVRRLLRRCLERDMHERLPDAAAARLELEDALAGRSDVEDEEITPVAAVPTWKKVLPWVLLGATAIALAASLVWNLPESAAPQRPIRLEVALSEDPLYVDLGSSVVLSPDGSKVAFASENESGDRTLSLRSLDQLDPLPIAAGRGDNRPYHPFFSPDGQWLGYTTPTELKKVPITGGTPITLCDAKRSRGATWTLDDSIVFGLRRGGLFQISAAGGEPMELTTVDEGKERSHRWPQALPNGKGVIFTVAPREIGNTDEAIIEVLSLESGMRKVIYEGGSYGRYAPTGHLVFISDSTLFSAPFDLDRLEVTGPPAPIVQGVTSLGGPAGAQYSFSNSGTLAYVRGAVEVPEYPVVRVERDGTITDLWETRASYGSPAISHDGKRLALSVFKDDNWDVWVYDLEREVATRLTFQDGYDADQIWSPDGEYLFYTSNSDGSVRPYRLRADGSGEAERLSETEKPFYPLSISPDGRYAIGETTENRIDIVVLDLEEGGEPEPFLATSFLDRDPQFSPDGKWVAYSSDESGIAEVYVRPFPTGSGRWQISAGGGRFPTWSGNGSELFYRTNDGILVASIEASKNTLTVGKAESLFEGSFRGGISGILVRGFMFRDFDVAPDGQSFVMFPDEQDREGNTHVTLIFNWFDELERTLPTSN